MRIALAAPALAAAAVFAAVPATAQLLPGTLRIACSAAGMLPDLLSRDYGERPAEQGVAGGALVQLWRNAETGTWTILLVRPDGTVCALASGEDWMPAGAPPPEGV